MTDHLHVGERKPTGAQSVLSVRDLSKVFASRYSRSSKSARGSIRAVDGVSFELPAGTTLGIVGESGCGKSTLARCLVRLERPTSGQILIHGTNILPLSSREFRRMRSRIQMVFQDPYAALTPRRAVGDQIGEAIRIHRIVSTRKEVDARVNALLDKVGLRPADAGRYPREFSGGQRQRICIARALAAEPEIMILDEPVSALDVSVQAQVINLLRDLQSEYDLSMIFISHDLSVVEEVSNRVAVMYLGRVVELGEVEEIFVNPLHPYTQALLSAAPVRRPEERGTRERRVLVGDVPSPANPPSGCHFRTRCWLAIEECAADAPRLQVAVKPAHLCACIRTPRFA